MKNKIKQFFRNFFQEHKIWIIFSSFWRLISFIQVLFWPYAFAKIVNIMSQNPENWKQAIFWTGLVTVNWISEDFIRLRSKLGLEKIAAKLRIDLAAFFAKKTKLRKGKKTGESVQAIKKVSESFESLINFFKDGALQLAVNFIVIPIVLSASNLEYLLLLGIYAIVYLIIDCFAVKFYHEKLKKYFRAAEIFWGTTYRKTPEIWRKREDGADFSQKIKQDGKKFYQANVSALNTNNWRWTVLQTLSSATIGFSVLFVIYKIVNGLTPVGDLILVSSYFIKTQETLNIISDSFSKIVEIKTSLKRLEVAVKIK